MATLIGTKIKPVRIDQFEYINLHTTKKSSLNEINNLNNQNDIQLNNLLHIYPEFISF